MMATIKEIIAMCKAGDVGEAYEIAKRDFMEWPQNIWVQRGLGWVLFYKIKNCAELRKKEELYNHFRELSELDLLTPQTDAYIFDNVLWKIAEYIKDIVNKEYVEDVERFYLLICKYKFPPSKPYSYLLKSYIKYETWSKMVDFLEWWNIENLLPEDYESFQMDNGRKIMSLAEQVYIAYSKALLKLNNKEKIQLFLPKIERLMDEYPEMVYPGYFCGKLMLVMGAERNEALNIVMPFVRKKKADFWVWQLIGDIYNDDSEMQLSCYLRAAHCRTKEEFLGKLRIKLARLYIEKQDYARAKYHINKVFQCYTINGWRQPDEIQVWINDANIQAAIANDNDGINYNEYTDNILRIGANQSIALITYVDAKTKRAILVYGLKKRASVKLSDLKVKVKAGSLIKIHWEENGTDKINVLGADGQKYIDIENLSYLKKLEGKITKFNDKPFAFLKTGNINCYINPMLVENNKLSNGDNASIVSVLDYNKKKEEWEWRCVEVKKRMTD